MAKAKNKDEDVMTVERLPLLEALNVVKPAIATKPLIEELVHVWFDGKHLTAYNDAELGIQVPLETPFTGGIQGSLLLGLLINSRAKQVKLQQGEDGSMVMKLANTKMDLTVLELERGQAMWPFTKMNKKKAITVDEDFIAALKTVLIAVGKDTTTPETLGVTFIREGDDALSLYTTDTSSIATIRLPLPEGFVKRKGRKVVPAAFCEQVMSLCSGGGLIEFCDDCVLGSNEDGVLIYARLIDAPSPIPMPDYVADAGKYPKACKFKVPDKLSMALDRMAVLFEGMQGEAMTVKLGGGFMKLSASIQGRGELKDSVDIPDTVPEVTFRTEPYLMKRALELATHIVCMEDTVRFSGDKGFVYIVSNAAA